MQEVVHSVFFAVVSVVVTLLTVGLTGVIILLATDRDTPHADSHQIANRRQAGLPDTAARPAFVAGRATSV